MISKLKIYIKELESKIQLLESENKLLSIKADENLLLKNEYVEVNIQNNDIKNRARKQRNVIAEIAADGVIHSGSIDQAFNKLTEKMADVLEVKRASIWLFAAEDTELCCSSLFDSELKKHSSGNVLKVEDYPRYFKAIHKDSRIYVYDAVNDLRTSEFSNDY